MKAYGRPWRRLVLSSLFLLSGLVGITSNSTAQSLPHFNVGWTSYAGWMPWAYAEQQGIIQRWAKRFNVDITMVHFDNYLDSVHQYTANQLDACAMTSIEAMVIPASRGIDSTAFLLTDYSNGADGIVLRGDRPLRDIRGKEILLVPTATSRYILERALQKAGLNSGDVKLRQSTDGVITSEFRQNQGTAAVLRYPQLHQLHHLPQVQQVFDSSQIPGEIQDLMLAKTDTLARHPELGMALTGAWYETLNTLRHNGLRAELALCGKEQSLNCNPNEFQAELSAIRFFDNPLAALKTWQSSEFQQKILAVRDFSFRHGNFGAHVMSADDVGIAFPDGEVAGSRSHIALRFSTAFTTLAAQRLLIP